MWYLEAKERAGFVLDPMVWDPLLKDARDAALSIVSYLEGAQFF